MKYNSMALDDYLSRAETMPPPPPAVDSVGEFVRQHAGRIQKLADRGWPLDELLQGLLDTCQDERPPSLRTLRNYYRRAITEVKRPRRSVRLSKSSGEE